MEVDGTSVLTLQDYKNFKSQLAQVTPTGVQSANFVPSNTPASCPSPDSGWSASAGPLPTDPVAAAVNNGGGATELSSPTGNSGSSSTGNTSSSSGLSSGAKVGLGVGVGLGAALLLAIGGFLLWRRKRSKKSWPEAKNEKDVVAEDPANMLHGESRFSEMEQPKSEMPVGGEALELEARHGESEMGRSTSSAVGKAGFEGRHELAGG